jgi:uncharacterized protein YlaI
MSELWRFKLWLTWKWLKFVMFVKVHLFGYCSICQRYFQDTHSQLTRREIKECRIKPIMGHSSTYLCKNCAKWLTSEVKRVVSERFKDDYKYMR